MKAAQSNLFVRECF